MPYIECKFTQTLTQSERDCIKSELGRAVALLHKPESYLMVGFSEGNVLYFGGRPLAKGAYVSVSLFGDAAPAACEKMTAEICAILRDKLGIPPDAVYVTYHPVENWGWNGSNF